MKPFRIVLPFVVLAVCGGIGLKIFRSQEEAPRFNAPPAVLTVEARRLAPTNYTVQVHSQGTVSPRTESTLIPEVSGRITDIAPAFRNGGFFETGDLLVQIDPSDYQSAVVVAEATLKQAEATLEIEKAQSEQARENWKQLGSGGEPSPLVLRVPQLEEAAASVAAAKARLERAKRDFERTRITAPYAGRILSKQVDVGQYVTPGTVLATIYAVDYAEIRLPLSADQQAFVRIPEIYRGEEAAKIGDGPPVRIHAATANRVHTWQGRLVRAEGAIDVRSRQLFVVAQVDDPYGVREEGKPPLKVGMFVEAEITGETLNDVFVIPRGAVRGTDEVLLIDGDNKFRRRQVDVLWRDSKSIVTSGPLETGDLLCVTAVPFAAEGGSVVPRIEGEGERRLQQQTPKSGGKGGRPERPDGTTSSGSPGAGKPKDA